MDEHTFSARIITLADYVEAEQELQAELNLSGDGDLLPDHVTKTEADTPCPRCTLVAAKAVEIADQREQLPN